MRDVPDLFKPVQLGRLHLPNRIALAPMTRERSPGGIPTPLNAEYYARRAAADVGLIITEGTYIDDPAAGTSDNVPHFHGDLARAGWRRIVAAVHAQGSCIFPQLWHVGMARKPDYGADAPVGPSALRYEATDKRWKQFGTPMSEARITAIVESYARAARLAMDIGCDGIELHGAHGYLIDQFFWHHTNRRTDGYNGAVGDIRARTVFACEVVRAIRAATHADFPICLRFSQWKTSDYDARLVESPCELANLLDPLVDAGVDIFHCSTRKYELPAFSGETPTLAGWTRKLSGKPTIIVGSIGLDAAHETRVVENQHGYVANPARIDRLLELLDQGEFDLAAVGRALLADAEWASKLKRGAIDDMRPYSTAIRDVYP